MLCTGVFSTIIVSVIATWITQATTSATTTNVGRDDAAVKAAAAAATATTTHTWTFTTFWSPYYSYLPIVYQMNNYRPFRGDSELATNRLFPSHPTPKTYKGLMSSSVSPSTGEYGSTSYLQAVKPEHRLFPSSLRPPPEIDNGPSAVEHRYFSYVSSSPSPTYYMPSRTLRKRAAQRDQLPISSTSVIFDESETETEQANSAVQVKTVDDSRQSPQPNKTEGKLVLEGLSLIGSLLRPGSRPGLLSSSSASANALNPFLASSSSNNHPLLASPSSSSSFLQQYSPFHFGGGHLHNHQPLHDLQSFLFPGASALFPNGLYPPLMPPPPFSSMHQQQHHGLQTSNPFYSGMPASPYQALGVDNLLVPLVGMIGLNLLRPDIIKSRREGVLSDLDGIDVFRNLQMNDDCLRRLACEAGVTVVDSDDAEAIQKALERALVARRLVPSRHVGRKATDVKRLQCGHHSCTSFGQALEDDIANDDTSPAVQFKQDTL